MVISLFVFFLDALRASISNESIDSCFEISRFTCMAVKKFLVDFLRFSVRLFIAMFSGITVLLTNAFVKLLTYSVEELKIEMLS